MTTSKKSRIITNNKNMKSITIFAALFLAMFIVMGSSGVMAARPMNETAMASVAENTIMVENPDPVDLRTAADFTILAKAGITNTVQPDTLVTGDMGVSPAAASTITGFDLEMDSSGEFSTSTYVDGRVYASDYAAGNTQAMLTTAVSDMEAAYTDAQGRVNTEGNPDYLDEGAGELAGETLYPGIHKWTTAVTISGDVTLDGQGNSNSVFIFQIPLTLDIASGIDAKVLLTDGAQASNIFWAAAGAVTLGTGSTFEGNILTGATSIIAMQTGATLNGRALSDGSVTLDANTVTHPDLLEISEFGLGMLIPVVATLGIFVSITVYRRKKYE